MTFAKLSIHFSPEARAVLIFFYIMQRSSLIKNLFILLLAPILAFGLFFLTRDLSGLTASVLDIAERQKIEEKKWWVAYKTDDQVFELFGSQRLKKGENLIFELAYNPQKVVVFVDQSSGFDFVILENTTGSLKVQLNTINKLNLDEGRFVLPFSWEKDQIVLAEASLWSLGKNVSSLSIGNLNAEEEHSLLP